MRKFFKKGLQSFFVVLGAVFVIIGVVGIFLPLLPTTPFLLLAAFCFNKGSDKFHYWLINHKVLGPPIRDWNEHRLIRLRHKILATLIMSATTLFFYIKVTAPVVGKISYYVFVICLMTFIWTRKSKI